MTRRDGWGTFNQWAAAADRHGRNQQAVSREETFSLTVAKYTAKGGVAFADGTQEEITDPDTGEIRTREKFYWFSKSQKQIRLEGYEAGAWPAEGTIVEVTMPEWLAKKVGLME